MRVDSVFLLCAHACTFALVLLLCEASGLCFAIPAQALLTKLPFTFGGAQLGGWQASSKSHLPVGERIGFVPKASRHKGRQYLGPAFHQHLLATALGQLRQQVSKLCAARSPPSCNAGEGRSPADAYRKGASAASQMGIGLSPGINTSFTKPLFTNATRSGSLPAQSRTVSWGASVSRVPAPTTTASAWARSLWPSARIAPLVIHLLVPSGRAKKPSTVWAHFSTTHGRPSCCTVRKPRFKYWHSASSTPVCTAIPAACNLAMPCPFTRLKGSCIPTTTWPTPRATSKLAQGGVRPWCAQGSKLTYRVASARGSLQRFALRPSSRHGPAPPPGGSPRQ